MDWLIVTFQFYFHIRSVEVKQEHIFSFQSNEGGRTVTSMNRLCESFSISMLNSDFASYIVCCLVLSLHLRKSS
jgi:hypothetical protein